MEFMWIQLSSFFLRMEVSKSSTLAVFWMQIIFKDHMYIFWGGRGVKNGRKVKGRKFNPLSVKRAIIHWLFSCTWVKGFSHLFCCKLLIFTCHSFLVHNHLSMCILMSWFCHYREYALSMMWLWYAELIQSYSYRLN